MHYSLDIFQIIIVQSADPEARNSPFGENSML